MNENVKSLLSEIEGVSGRDYFELRNWRDRFRNNFENSINEAERISLLEAHAKVFDLTEAYLFERNSDLSALLAIRRAEWLMICYLEAQYNSGNAFLIPGEFQKIVQREIDAGRMKYGPYSNHS